MQLTKATVQVLKVCSTEGLLEKLLDCNRSLDMI